MALPFHKGAREVARGAHGGGHLFLRARVYEVSGVLLAGVASQQPCARVAARSLVVMVCER